MENNTDFFNTPDYYDSFRCKGGSCRNTCCMGYSVGISMPEYFKLVGLTCSDDLRRRLDCGLEIREKPEKTDYAVIEPDWYGRCHALGEDGLCLLQKEQGAGVLPAVCRYYPRSPKRKYDSECSCATACEEVLELLLHRRTPMTFSVRKLSFDMELEERDEDSGKIREYPSVHKKIIGLMQQREYSIDRRIENIGRELNGCTDPVPAVSLLPENRDADMQVLPELIEWCGREYPTLSPFADRVKSTFGKMSPEERKKKTEFLLARMEKTFPGTDRFFEQLLVNDMMFVYSPYTDGRLPVSFEYEALKIIHGMLCLLTACNTDENSTEKELIDVCVFFFRAVEFTAFRYNMFVLNGSAGNDNNDDNDNNNDDDNGNAA